MIVFWILQALVILQAFSTLAVAINWVNTDGQESDFFKNLHFSYLSLDIVINTILLIILVDAFLRLNKLVKHHGLALSKLQMFLHIGSFVITTLTTTLICSEVIYFSTTPLRLSNASWRLDSFFKTSEIFIYGLFIPSISLLFIINSLLDEEIAEKSEEENRFVSG